MRAATPLAAIGLLQSKRRGIGALLATFAAGELAYDKLPTAEERTAPAPFLGRVFTGATAGGLAARALGGSLIGGGLAGAAAALVGTLVFHRLRALASTRVSPTLAAVGEDLLSIGLSAGALQRA